MKYREDNGCCKGNHTGIGMTASPKALICVTLFMNDPSNARLGIIQ